MIELADIFLFHLKLLKLSAFNASSEMATNYEVVRPLVTSLWAVEAPGVLQSLWAESSLEDTLENTYRSLNFAI